MIEKKQVLIVNKTTGEQRTGHQMVKVTQPPRQENGIRASSSIQHTEQAAAEPTSSTSSETAGSTSTKQNSKKTKTRLTSFFSLIEYGYSRKGQRVNVRKNDLKLIATNMPLTEADTARLHTLATQDKLFAVPRQLLLLARELHEETKVRSGLRDFVGGLLVAHPIIVINQLQGFVQNQEDSTRLTDAFRAITEIPSSSLHVQLPIDDLRTGEIATLKRNVIGCLSVWVVDTRATSIRELISALTDGYWRPLSTRSSSESDIVRALTEVDDPAFARAVCEEFTERLAEQARITDRAVQTTATARADLDSVSTAFRIAQARLAEIEAEVERLRNLVQVERDRTRIEATHLRDDFETLRTRVLRRMSDDLQLLADGLVALNRNPPKVEVMRDHAERVADSLRVEIKKLQEQ